MARALPVALLLLLSSPAHATRPYSKGAAAAAHPLGSAAATEILEAGGNAVDAVVAAAFTMAVVGPYHSGLGGGGFAVIHLAKENRDLAFDFREVAPLRASRDMFLVDGVFQQQLSTDGPLSIAVPGAVAGYLELQAKYGKLPRARVLAPAIRAAKQGFVITPKYRDLAKNREACLRADEDAARVYLRPGPDGVPTAPALGTILTQPDLANTLTVLARDGASAFYTGALGKALVASVQKKGGLITLEDLAKFHPRWRTPLEGQYRGARLVTMPPPSAGGLAILQTLGMLEARGLKGPASHEVEAVHGFIEALRLAYVDRAKYLGDPDALEVPTGLLASPQHVQDLAARIDPARATRSSTLFPDELKAPVSTDAGPGPRNTTHLSVIDGEGNAVALTTTINFYFGSCVMAKGTGVLLNDEMDDFAGQPGTPNVFGLVTGAANAIAPGKIPLSSMSPTLVFMKDRPSEVWLAVGSPGGSTIPTTVLQVISNVVDGNLDVSRAVNQGRIHHQWLPDEVWVDKTALDPLTAKALEAMGHTLKRLEGWGDAEAVMVDPITGLRSAASDPRNEGAPSGL